MNSCIARTIILPLALTVLAPANATELQNAATVSVDTADTSQSGGLGRETLTVEDILSIQKLGVTQPSPDGKLIALEIGRAANADSHRHHFDSEGWDVWLYSRDNAQLRNLTNGARDGSSYGSPSWSPGGERLAFTARTDDALMGLYVWDRRSNATHRVGDTELESSTVAWLTDTTLVCVAAPAALRELSQDGRERLRQTVDREWAKAARGIEPTASVLQSGRDLPAPERPQLHIVVLDVTSGKMRTVADTETSRIQAYGLIWSVSPTKHSLLLIPADLPAVPRADQPVELVAPRTRFAVASLAADTAAPSVRWVSLPAGLHLDGRFVWSPAGESLAVHTVHGRPLDAVSAERAVDGEPLQNGENRRHPEWFLTVGGGPLVKVSDKDPMHEKVLAWVSRAKDVSQPPNPARPTRHASLAAYLPEQHLSVFASEEIPGPSVWIGDGTSSRFTEILHLNPRFVNIKPPTQRVLTYRGADGDTLHAVLRLPYGYRSGIRYPTVTWVYEGEVYPPSLVGVADNLVFRDAREAELELLTSHGYVVLFPDMPLPPEGVANDDYLDMPKGVMGAIDEAIALGIADPDRTALMGDSYGGYSVYSLLTYTRRFKAAIASAGLPDLGAAYGVFPASMRYDGNNARLMGARLHYNEQGQDHMGGPPSANVWRYLTNSPVYHLDRVETPLLMIHGDMDDVPMGGTEEYFTGLYRLGKRAEFVRYWGEGHWLVSPANIRDMWARIFAWLDEFDDVSRDATGNIIFDGDHVRSRNGAPALKPEDFLRFERQTKP